MKSPIRFEQFDPANLHAESLGVDPKSFVKLMAKAEPFGFWSLDVKTGEVWWSDEVYKIHGMKPRKAAVNLSRAVALYHPADAKTVEFLIGDAIANKQGYDFVMRLNRADGKTRYVQSIASIELDADQNVKTVFGIIRDVTQSISDKNISKTRAQLVSSILANSPSPIVILDRNLCYLQISPAWAEFHGLKDPNSYIGKSHYEVLPEIPDEWKEEHKRVLNGEVIHRSRALNTGTKSRSSSTKGSSVFPWHTALGEIGGLIIMVTPGNPSNDSSNTVAQIARLFEQTSPKSHRFGEIR